MIPREIFRRIIAPDPIPPDDQLIADEFDKSAREIARRFGHSQIRFIFGIPDGGISLAHRVAMVLVNASVIRTIKLTETAEKSYQLNGWQNPDTFPVYSHKAQNVRTIAWEMPVERFPVLVVDNVYQLGLTAESVIGQILRSGFPVAGFAVSREWYPDTLIRVSRDFGVPVLSSVTGQR